MKWISTCVGETQGVFLFCAEQRKRAVAERSMDDRSCLAFFARTENSIAAGPRNVEERNRNERKSF